MRRSPIIRSGGCEYVVLCSCKAVEGRTVQASTLALFMKEFRWPVLRMRTPSIRLHPRI